MKKLVFLKKIPFSPPPPPLPRHQVPRVLADDSEGPGAGHHRDVQERPEDLLRGRQVRKSRNPNFQVSPASLQGDDGVAISRSGVPVLKNREMHLEIPGCDVPL